LASPSSPSGLFRFDQAWVRLETRIAVAVVVLEVVDLVLWVSLKGLAADYSTGNPIGLLYRMITGGILVGLLAYWPMRNKSPGVARGAALGGIIAGALFGRLLAETGADWASNVVGFVQNSSTMSLIGGLRGLATRLTLWLALLGGSIAAGKGKHINIDVATRYLPDKLVVPTAILGWLLAAIVCFAASYGFTDSIAVTKFRAEAFHNCPDGEGLCDTGFGHRMGKVAEGMSSDFFLLRRQIVLDLSTLPRVLAGTKYDTYLTAAEWNEFIDNGDWAAHFSPEAVKGLKMSTDDPTATKMPAVVAPDTGEGRDLLIRDLNFILPFGLLIIGLKFVLRIILVLKGEIKVEAGHGAPEGEPKEVTA
jgi:hypothetical protein